jgi:predicted phosphodiesterase
MKMASTETLRLAVLSDVHGNLIALETVLADLEAQGGADLTWYLGDLVAGPRPVECIQLIKALSEVDEGKKFKVIGGNVDRDIVTGSRFPMLAAKDGDEMRGRVEAWSSRDTMLNWSLGQLGWEEYEFLSKIIGHELWKEIDGYGTVIGYHAVPGDDLAMLRPDTPDEEAVDYMLDREGRLGIGGHTHIQMNRTIGRWQLVNVGSIGLSVDRPGYAQYGILTFEKGRVDVDLRNIPYNVDALIADLYAVGHPVPQWIENRIRAQAPSAAEAK